MNGIHDMGGMQGFGPVQPEADEPVFHADWEARCLALNREIFLQTPRLHEEAARAAREGTRGRKFTALQDDVRRALVKAGVA